MTALAPATKLPRYVELVRVSTQGQKDRDTPEDQRRALDRLRTKRPGVLVERIDLAVSGATDTASRPDIQRLKVLATARAFDEVRVRHIDRLTRHEDPAERFVVYSLIAEAGGVIVDAAERETDPNTELGELDYYIQTMMAARERKRIVERTRSAKQRKASEGRLAQGQPPYGRTFDKATGRWGLDPVRAKLYRRMFEWCLAGRSLAEIATALSRTGTRTPRNREWNDATVGKLLHAETAFGRYVSHGYPIAIPPIVDEATFREVEAKLHANNSKSGPRPRVFALLRKLAVCAECGSPVYVLLGGGTPARHRYYHCAAQDPACHVYHRVKDVDAKVQEALRRWLDDPETLAAAAGHQRPEDVRTSAEADITEVERELRLLEKRQLNVARLLSQDDIDAKQSRTLLDELKGLRGSATTRLAEAQARLAGAHRQVAVHADLADDLQAIRQGLTRATPERWRGLCERLFQRGDVRLFASGKIEFRGRVRVGRSPLNSLPPSGRR